jgi:hypothetical protein
LVFEIAVELVFEVVVKLAFDAHLENDLPESWK